MIKSGKIESTEWAAIKLREGSDSDKRQCLSVIYVCPSMLED